MCPGREDAHRCSRALRPAWLGCPGRTPARWAWPRRNSCPCVRGGGHPTPRSPPFPASVGLRPDTVSCVLTEPAAGAAWQRLLPRDLSALGSSPLRRLIHVFIHPQAILHTYCVPDVVLHTSGTAGSEQSGPAPALGGQHIKGNEGRPPKQRRSSGNPSRRRRLASSAGGSVGRAARSEEQTGFRAQLGSRRFPALAQAWRLGKHERLHLQNPGPVNPGTRRARDGSGKQVSTCSSARPARVLLVAPAEGHGASVSGMRHRPVFILSSVSTGPGGSGCPCAQRGPVHPVWPAPHGRGTGLTALGAHGPQPAPPPPGICEDELPLDNFRV